MVQFPFRPTTNIFLLVVLSLLLAAAPRADACEPASAVARYENGPCVEQAPYKLCFAGPCKNKLGALEAMGRFAVVKPNSSWELDFVTWNTLNLDSGATQQVSVVDGPEVCGPAPISVPGCVERYRIPNVKACPPFQGPNCPGNKVTATLRSLEQVNAATTPGGIVTLPDGQTIKGKGRKRFWLHYEVCCPDVGTFGTPGDLLKTDIRYGLETGGGGIAIACQERSARQADPERIPDQTFPCGP